MGELLDDRCDRAVFFGLAIAGISDKAAKSSYKENNYKFNDGSELQHHEFSDGSGLELYSTDFRGYDPQIGRFHQQDALADIFREHSVYSYGSDNPVTTNDPTGLAAMDWILDFDGTVFFDSNVHSQEEAEALYGPVLDLGPEAELHDERKTPMYMAMPMVLWVPNRWRKW